MTHEGALHLEDMMTTRTRLTYEMRDHGLAAADEIASLMADELGWDAERLRIELDAYRARSAAETAAAAAPDDAAAQAARLRTGDVLAELAGSTRSSLS